MPFQFANKIGYETRFGGTQEYVLVPPEVNTEEEDPSAIIWPTEDVPPAPSVEDLPPSPPTLPPPPPKWPDGSWTLDFPVPPSERSGEGSQVEPTATGRKRPYKAVGRKRKADEMEDGGFVVGDGEESDEKEKAESSSEEMVVDETGEEEEEDDGPPTPKPLQLRRLVRGLRKR